MLRRHSKKSMYTSRSTFSWPRHSLASGKLHAPAPLTPEKESRNPLDRRLRGPQNRYGRHRGLELRPLGRPASTVATLTALSRLQKLRGLSPRVNYTDRAAAAFRWSKCQLSADKECCVVSATDTYGRILGFLDRSRYFFFQVAPQLYSRGWVDQLQGYSNTEYLFFRPSM
jgi:hypothetical protein